MMTKAQILYSTGLCALDVLLENECDLPPFARDIISQCLQVRPSQRPSPTQLLKKVIDLQSLAQDPDISNGEINSDGGSLDVELPDLNDIFRGEYKIDNLKLSDVQQPRHCEDYLMERSLEEVG